MDRFQRYFNIVYNFIIFDSCIAHNLAQNGGFCILNPKYTVCIHKQNMIPKKICDMCCGNFDTKNLDLALLILRVVLGIAFIYHGWPKVSGMEGTVAMFGSMGVPAWLTYIAAYVELLGGIVLLAGGATKLVTSLLGVFMLAAIYLVHLDKGYSMMAGGYEYQLLIIAGLAVINLVGPGAYSAHRKVCATN